ncbi:hypothetical protein D7147_25980 [Micromonospora musae]|uniref:Uncharacterized protein n=1 Tax=Micromonospora musae TaxID=1894970 RepID=A0ABX9QXM8_9ACTN|nr:hypothetical protein [Micromonospora musae]RKN15303.1 hypothetical protein D7147_25980 [Micromonospora musae]
MSRPWFGVLAALLLTAGGALAGATAAGLVLLAGLVGWLAVRILGGDVAATGLGDRVARRR